MDAGGLATLTNPARAGGQVGQPAPDMGGADWLNTPRSLPLARLKDDKIVLLDFWATR